MKFKLFCLGTTLLSLWSCSSEEVISSQDVEMIQESSELSVLFFTVSDTTRTIGSESKAIEVADRFREGSGINTRANSEKDVAVVYQNNGSPAMYVVNYGEDEGFVIVSATKDVEPILAYSETGSFNLDNIEGSPAGLWLNDAKLNVEHSSEFPDSVKLCASRQWETLTSTRVPVSKPNTRGWLDPEEAASVNACLSYYLSQGYEIHENPYPNVHIYSPNMNRALESLSDIKDYDGYSQREKSFILEKHSNEEYKVLPMTKTKWEQGSPYNAKLKQRYPNADALGCVTVAVAQLMKYYGKSNGGFQYDKMPNVLGLYDKGIGYETLTDFMLTIGEKLGIDYNKGKSNADEGDAVRVLKLYGFQNAKSIDYDNFFTIKGSLGRGPVMLAANKDGGGGHAWVCDGYEHYLGHTEYIIISYNGMYMDAIPTACFDTIYTEQTESGSYHMYMNWGWGGVDDGYFSEKWQIVSDKGEIWDYSKNRKAVINLY